ncbi:MAG: hypothetical protein IT460_13095 [Planctomycetes bacterium]|nr:hypothetical protein [Planctomycetota bacterium]
MSRPSPSVRRDAGLAVLGVVALVVGYGTWFPAVVAAALAWLWWGRALGMAAMFALAVSVAAWATEKDRGPAKTTKAAAAARVVGAEAGSTEG